MQPLGFWDIGRFLTGDDSLRMTTSIPLELMPPGLVAGSAMTIMMSTGIHHDERTGTIYMSM